MSWNSCVIKERDRKEDEEFHLQNYRDGFYCLITLSREKKKLKAIPHHLFNYRLIKIPNIPKKLKGLS